MVPQVIAPKTGDVWLVEEVLDVYEQLLKVTTGSRTGWIYRVKKLVFKGHFWKEAYAQPKGQIAPGRFFLYVPDPRYTFHVVIERPKQDFLAWDGDDDDFESSLWMAKEVPA